MGARGAAVNPMDKTSAVMDLKIHGKDGWLERQIRTSKGCTGLRAVARTGALMELAQQIKLSV